MALGLATVGLAASSTAGAADIRLGLNTGAGVSCQVAAGRVGVQEGRFGIYGQGGYCNSNVEGKSGTGAFGGLITGDLFTFGNVTTYGLVGAELQGNSTAIHGGLGLRYGIALLPVEAYLEAGVQRTNTALLNIIGPRLAVGVNYRINVANLQGQIPAPFQFEDGTTIQYAGSAPAECNLTQEQDVASARGAANSAAAEGLGAAASAYGAAYSNVSYKVEVTGVGINGNTGSAGGKVTVSATQNSNGERVSGVYGGTIKLVRAGCGWQATGYTRG
ncbi:hypothetical protein [Deinococcus arenicola]|uniref:Uncharacterized protein n=1 Tax=Deinococcus arenicola TaxID=2994950 RepID=A0ABU4DQK5_9DEIO|nr:hypothetical protein [Deinococcus sp. ZS9-10]MDV6373984.1 hypothetical protein [Deinococcus sp. ZS9-10]